MRSIIIAALFTASASLSLFAQTKMDATKPSPASPAKATPTPAAAPAKAVVEANQEAKATKKEAKETAKEVKSEAKSAAGAMDDASITKAVKEKLASLPSLKDKNIDVMVSGGVATLKGKVDKAGLKGVATNAAKKIAGVKKVDNQIEVEKKK
ncbi:MAG: BON domain-containing protein [Candidatus Kapabacteria bacterium]|nr:BON domain-containing protein [Candidatus Kapabacteria bacterium]